MYQIYIKTLTRHRATDDPLYLRDWTGGDIAHINTNPKIDLRNFPSMLKTGIVLNVEGEPPNPQDVIGPVVDKNGDLVSRSKKIINLRDNFTDLQIKDFYNHDLVVDPFTVAKSYLDLIIDPSERTAIDVYDKSGSVASGTIYVSDRGGAGVYATFLLAEADLAATLTGAVVIDADDDAAVVDSSQVYIVGTTTSAANTLTLKCTGAAFHGGAETATAHRFTAASTTGAIFVREEYVNLIDLQTLADGAGAVGIYASAIDAAGILNIDSCYLRGAYVADYSVPSGIYINDSDFTVHISNTIVRCFRTNQANQFLILIGAATAATITNCTVDGTASGAGKGIRDVAGSKITVKNTAVFNTGDDFYGTFALIDSCASDDGDGDNPIAPSGSDWDNEFTNHGAGDYTVLNTGNLYLKSDITQADDANVPADDIIGTARNTGAGTQTSIGAFEYVAAGGETTLITALAFKYFQMMRKNR